MLMGSIATILVPCNQMTFDAAQYMPQVLSIRPVGRLGVAQLQRLSRLLHEIHELMDFKKRDEGIEQSGQIALHESHQGGPPGGHVGYGARLRGRSTLSTVMGLKHDNA